MRTDTSESYRLERAKDSFGLPQSELDLVDFSFVSGPRRVILDGRPFSAYDCSNSTAKGLDGLLYGQNRECRTADRYKDAELEEVGGAEEQLERKR